MRGLVLMFLAGCATHDVLHAEPLVARTACTADMLGVFGYPFEAQACGAQVQNLGDGCYLARQPPDPRVVIYECATDTPDRHVACVRDDMPDQGPLLFGGDPSTQTTWAIFPDGGRFARKHGRCRARRHDWLVSRGVQWPRVELGLGEIRTYPRRGIDRGTVLVKDDSTISTDEDAWSLARIIDFRRTLYATACPRGIVAIEASVPARLAASLRFGIVMKLAFAQIQLDHCERISVEVTAPRQIRETDFAR